MDRKTDDPAQSTNGKTHYAEERYSGETTGQLKESVSRVTTVADDRESEMATALMEQSMILDSLTKGVMGLRERLDPVIVHEEEKPLGDTERDSKFASVRARQIDSKTNQLRSLDQIVAYLNRTVHV